MIFTTTFSDATGTTTTNTTTTTTTTTTNNNNNTDETYSTCINFVSKFQLSIYTMCESKTSNMIWLFFITFCQTSSNA